MTPTLDTEPIRRVLHDHPLFAGLSEVQRDAMAACATTRAFKPGDVLLQEGACADRFHVLLSGTVAVQIAAPGRGRITLQTLHGGDVLGWSWLIPPYRWSFAATAKEPTEAVVFDAPSLRRVIAADHEIAFHLLPRFVAVMADRLHAARLQMLDLYGPPS